MTNKLTLEQILSIVQKKYPEAEIKEEDQYSIISKHNSIYYVSYNNKRIWPNDFDNIIELKHYLGIDIKWEDLKEYCISKKFELVPRNETWSNYETIEEYLQKGIGIFYKYLEILKGGVIKFNDEKLATNRSYWQMYNIIKNLVEN